MIGITPLESWIREKADIDRRITGTLFEQALKTYQLKKLNEIIDYARRNVPYYRHQLAAVPVVPLSDIADISNIPFTASSDLANDPSRFLAVRQDDIARIVTLRTSGSTGEAKRLFFTEDDLELTVDFFCHGMSTIVGPGQRVAILLPAASPDSVGDLLGRGLRRLDVDALPYGPVTNPSHAVEAVASFGAHCLVGIPTHVLAMASSPAGVALGKGRIGSVLLSTDYVPRAIVKTLEDVWGCRVFSHYGMTEMGLGGGVECEALDGYHLREADLYFEVVDPETGEVCPDGVLGEVVFTTLSRRGMPLIRYRTGDIARFITGCCPCGSILRRLERVRGRWNGIVALAPDGMLTLAEIDEVLFRLPGLLDYRVILSKGGDGRFGLLLDVHRAENSGLTGDAVLQALNELVVLRKSFTSGSLAAPCIRFTAEWRWTTTGVSKRKIVSV